MSGSPRTGQRGWQTNVAEAGSALPDDDIGGTPHGIADATGVVDRLLGVPAEPGCDPSVSGVGSLEIPTGTLA